MAVKEVAIGKRAKISEAQKYMLLAVFGASIVLGIALALVMHFIKQISFNAEVIIQKDQAIVAYSDVIKNTGICKKPSGQVYSPNELKSCNPDSIDVSQIPGTLRANILENVAASEALNSVPKEDSNNCINQATGKNFTYKELNQRYDEAKNTEELVAASQLIKSCSALRVIPDALPANQNEEALLASLNKLFLFAGREPESLSPSYTITAAPFGENLNMIVVNFALNETDAATTYNLLDNIERSIREYNIDSSTLSWNVNTGLSFRARATAFFMRESSISEITKTIKAEDKK